MGIYVQVREGREHPAKDIGPSATHTCHVAAESIVKLQFLPRTLNLSGWGSRERNWTYHTERTAALNNRGGLQSDGPRAHPVGADFFCNYNLVLIKSRKQCTRFGYITRV